MFVLPLGDEPNPPAAPVVTCGLILVNCAAYVVITLPLGFVRPEWTDPTVQAYLGAWVEAFPGPVSRRDVAEMYTRLTAYDLFVFRWGFRAAEPRAATLFTAMFLHAGLVHLVGNMLFLWICGDNVEHRLGRVRFLAAYLGTGIAATAVQTMLTGRSALPLVGASGAVFGVAGFYWVWFARNRVRIWVMLFPFFMNVVRIPARPLLGFFVLVQNLLPFLTASPARGGDAHGAHLGGFLAGLLLARFVNRGLRRANDAPAGDAPPAPGSLAALVEDGDYETAARRYVRLSAAETRRLLSARHSLLLGRWMAARRHPHAALALFEQHVRDHPVSPTAAEAHLAAGLLQLRTFSAPAAAARHLHEALALEPDPETAAEARRGLTEIAALENFQLNRLRPTPDPAAGAERRTASGESRGRLRGSARDGV